MSLRLREGAQRSAGVTRLSRGAGPSTWVPLPPAPGRVPLVGLSGAASCCSEPLAGLHLGRAQLGAWGCCLGPASSLPASHCRPPGPLISPTKWLESSWFLDPRSAAGVLPGFYLLLLSTCRHWEASLPCLPSPLFRYRPVVIFLCLLAGATLSLLTDLLSLGDCKAPEPGPQECMVLLQSALQGSSRPRPSQPFVVRAAFPR